MGWKDILRPIRDGFRDNIPSRKPEDDNENERRRERREQDALKGFTYLESFEELKQWTPDHISSVQRANTPLLPRSKTGNIERRNESTVTLIHDYSGNYHDYEAAQGSSLDHEAYSCEYLQFVDSFVYFSHKLVCVPPPSWTNTLHRNGVKSLGTFLVEPQSSSISNILHRSFSAETKTWDYTMASQLIQIARCCGFDGWLLNIEKTFPITDWKREDLVGFIQQLKSAFGNRCIIWYDSLTTNNTIRYQNGLTPQNILFAQAAGAMLTNYAWDPQKAVDSKMLALRNGIDPEAIIFGIDVWAQDTGSQKQGRTTYPPDEGGGTGTGLGVAKLAEIGLSAGIFAPAWPYEHFPTSSKDVEKSMWIGDSLPNSLQCDCTPKDRHCIQHYRENPILRHAREVAAGSESFFYTNFSRSLHRDGDRYSASIGSQSILPCLKTPEAAKQETLDGECTIFGQLEDKPSRIVLSMQPGSKLSAKGSLRLFKLWMKGPLTLSVKYRKPETPENLQIWLGVGDGFAKIAVPYQACEHNTLEQKLGCQERPEHITGIFVGVDGVLQIDTGNSTLRLIELVEVCIKSTKRKTKPHTIHGVLLDSRDRRCTRLCWNISMHEAMEEAGTEDGGMPHSELTGPFSYFVIEVDGREIGKAYSLEYLLETRTNDDAEVRITGIGFDGELICKFEGVAQQIQQKGSVDGWDII